MGLLNKVRDFIYTHPKVAAAVGAAAVAAGQFVAGDRVAAIQTAYAALGSLGVLALAKPAS
jgi:hypothetical protein